MSAIKTNYLELYARNNELRLFKQQNPTVVELCMKKQYEKWGKENALILERLGEHLVELYVLHVMNDGNGGWQKKEDGTPIFKSPEDEVDFKTSWDNVMQMKCTIQL